MPHPPPHPPPPPPHHPSRDHGLSYGRLHVWGNTLYGENGRTAQLRGMSSHGLLWYWQFVNESMLRWLAYDWQINVFRAAMMIEPEIGGYVHDHWQQNNVIQAIDAAIKLNIYVIVDWHVLGSGDPNIYREQAKGFFREITARYGNSPNIIYEICNEPNGGDVHWGNKIKPYALDVIPVIRAAAPDSLILVGTGNWSQDVQEPAADPLPFANVMYVAHFYAGSHTQWLRDRIDGALQKNVAIFISEWGVSSASGDGGPYYDEANRWLDFIHRRRLSFVNWSLSDKQEVSAALNPGASQWGWLDDNSLSGSGYFVRQAIRDSAHRR